MSEPYRPSNGSEGMDFEHLRAFAPAPIGRRPVTLRCIICHWPLAENREKGCAPGDCSYRPEDPAEQARIRERRAELAAQQLVSTGH